MVQDLIEEASRDVFVLFKAVTSPLVFHVLQKFSLFQLVEFCVAGEEAFSVKDIGFQLNGHDLPRKHLSIEQV